MKPCPLRRRHLSTRMASLGLPEKPANLSYELWTSKISPALTPRGEAPPEVVGSKAVPVPHVPERRFVQPG
jgi:hypothetical protein